jgi:hypothetical protein
MINSLNVTEIYNSQNIQKKINDILDNNKIDDLLKFLNKRKNLNNTNAKLIYIYHALQNLGILTTTLALGYNLQYLIWIGIGMNCAASLINIYEQLNNTMLNKLLNNIKLIKDNKYIDEDSFVDIEMLSNINNQNISSNQLIKNTHKINFNKSNFNKSNFNKPNFNNSDVNNSDVNNSDVNNSDVNNSDVNKT